MQIESPANPRIRSFAALRERRARTEAGLTLVDGVRECGRALSGNVIVETAIVCDALVRTDAARALVTVVASSSRQVEILRVGERAYEKVAFGDRFEGIVLVVRVPDTSLAGIENVTEDTDALVVVTEDVEKPGNLGAILRSADGAGAAAVIAVGGTDLYNPNVIRASAGTIFHLPVAAGAPGATLAWLRDAGFRILAARVDASTPYTGADLRGRIALVLGSEATGLSAVWDSTDVSGISLPMAGVADSLNVSAAAAILLYEARRQRAEGLGA
jgi:TrmH family RNA methyltransferase